MPFLLYLFTTSILLWLTVRYLRPMSRAAALVVCVLPLGLTGLALVTGGVYGPIDHLYQNEPFAVLAPSAGIGIARNASAVDVISEFFPWRRAVQESFARGEWPLWNAYNLCGHPLAAEAQSAPYSPFTLLACLLPAAASLSYTAAIALFLAALSAFLFARELGCGEGAALFAAAGWSLAASIVLYSETTMGFTTALLPLVLMATLRVVRRPGIASGALLTTVLVLTVLSGHPESLFLNVLVGCAYGLFELVRARIKPSPAIATAAGAGLTTLFLCAIFLLPLLEAIPQSHEYRWKSGTAFAPVNSGPQVLGTLATNFFPQLHVRPWESPSLAILAAETAAVGSIALGLAMYAIWRKRSAETWFFAALAVTGMAFGTRAAPLVKAWRALPLLDITLQERLVFSAALALVILAALGMEEIVAKKDFRAAAATLAIVFVVLAAGMFWIARNVVLGPVMFGRFRPFAELFFLALAILLLIPRPAPRVIVTGLLGLLCAQRLLSEVDTFQTYRASLAYPPIALFEPLKSVREPFRFVGRGTAIPPATNTFYGLEDPRGYEALTLEELVSTEPLWCGRHGIWFNRVDDLTLPFLSFLNVRFAIQSEVLPRPAGWRTVRVGNRTVLLENEHVLPRMFIPRQVALTTMTTQEIVERMADVRDFANIAWIETAQPAGLRDNGPGALALRSRSPGGRSEFDADMQRGGYVVLSDTAWKGWRAYVDGRDVPVHRANAAFLAVFVPRGHHSVRLVYRPSSFVIGAWISFATLAAVVALAILRRVWSAATPVAALDAPAQAAATGVEG